MEALITMTGHVGGEVESRPTRLTQTPSATFRLACTPRVNRRGNWSDGETTWLTVTCYRSLAENAALSLHKGDPVLVSGKLRTQIWTDDSGVRHERTVLEASTIGHDLSRGSTRFRRSERAVPVEDDGRDIGEMIASVEAQARADGEPLDPAEPSADDESGEGAAGEGAAGEGGAGEDSGGEEGGRAAEVGRAGRAA